MKHGIAWIKKVHIVCHYSAEQINTKVYFMEK